MKITFKQGFTLMELLAVVIILAILASLSLGSYKKSVEQSRFAEGLAAASAVVEAINRARFDEKIEGREIAVTDKHAYATLDLKLPNECDPASKYCRATKYFDVYIENSSATELVRAYRGSKNDYTYYIEMYTNYATSKDKLACVGNASNEEKGKVFCQSMGYTRCTDHSCTK